MKNEPAFPRPFSYDEGDVSGGPQKSQKGMTLRDYFAAKAMQGILANDINNYENNSLAKVSYEIAEAMLKEREK